jgi:hypothetical protein
MVHGGNFGIWQITGEKENKTGWAGIKSLISSISHPGYRAKRTFLVCSVYSSKKVKKSFVSLHSTLLLEKK